MHIYALLSNFAIPSRLIHPCTLRLLFKIIKFYATPSPRLPFPWKCSAPANLLAAEWKLVLLAFRRTDSTLRQMTPAAKIRTRTLKMCALSSAPKRAFSRDCHREG
ncbi:hypothetical protein AVEN_153084-1 [Araneus ventricosus]|uniref:Uncharacterized protein n=1 Tax=Araneus ventricosus TaxID=182803 RepID=A0A4Y2E653_ARAVE|nr:hypothetical protein AVEN_153084-1 [Araneus ventricosus]